jgi:hypothetical protein
MMQRPNLDAKGVQSGTGVPDCHCNSLGLGWQPLGPPASRQELEAIHRLCGGVQHCTKIFEIIGFCP